MATQQITVPKIDFDTILDVVGTVCVCYLAWVWSGGEPIPVLKTFVPFVAVVAAGVVFWRHARRNNKPA